MELSLATTTSLNQSYVLLPILNAHKTSPKVFSFAKNASSSPFEVKEKVSKTAVARILPQIIRLLLESIARLLPTSCSEPPKLLDQSNFPSELCFETKISLPPTAVNWAFGIFGLKSIEPV